MTEKIEPGMLHATAVAINGAGILLLGPSGSGKSDMALRLIDRGATLISDDGVLVEAGDPFPLLRTAPNIAGMIEIRGVGIVKMPFADSIPLNLAVALADILERLPPPEQSKSIAGSEIPFVRISAFESSAPIKVEQALRLALEGSSD